MRDDPAEQARVSRERRLGQKQLAVRTPAMADEPHLLTRGGPGGLVIAAGRHAADVAAAHRRQVHTGKAVVTAARSNATVEIKHPTRQQTPERLGQRLAETGPGRAQHGRLDLRRPGGRDQVRHRPTEHPPSPEPVESLDTVVEQVDFGTLLLSDDRGQHRGGARAPDADGPGRAVAGQQPPRVPGHGQRFDQWAEVQRQLG